MPPAHGSLVRELSARQVGARSWVSKPRAVVRDARSVTKYELYCIFPLAERETTPSLLGVLEGLRQTKE
jgi:hypothetical protein